MPTIRGELEISPKAIPDQALRRLWAALDEDGSGFLTAGELGHFKPSLPLTLTLTLSPKPSPNSSPNPNPNPIPNANSHAPSPPSARHTWMRRIIALGEALQWCGCGSHLVVGLGVRVRVKSEG